jgi:hypothetical protein
VVPGGLEDAVAARLPRHVEGPAEEHARHVAVGASLERLELLLGAVLELDVEHDVGEERLVRLVVEHVDHGLRRRRPDVLPVDGAVRVGRAPLAEVRPGLLVAVAEDPLGHPVAAHTRVVVLRVARVEREPVGVVDVGLLVARLAEVGGTPHPRLDGEDVAVEDGQLEVHAIGVVPGRHQVGAEVELQVLDRARRLGLVAVAPLHDRLAGILRLVVRRGGWRYGRDAH